VNTNRAARSQKRERHFSAKGLDTKQLLDVLIAVGGYRATSMAINSAGVQLDANMADFRFPPSLR